MHAEGTDGWRAVFSLPVWWGSLLPSLGSLCSGLSTGHMVTSCVTIIHWSHTHYSGLPSCQDYLVITHLPFWLAMVSRLLIGHTVPTLVSSCVMIIHWSQTPYFGLVLCHNYSPGMIIHQPHTLTTLVSSPVTIIHQSWLFIGHTVPTLVWSYVSKQEYLCDPKSCHCVGREN
jgi:hypothetical protein